MRRQKVDMLITDAGDQIIMPTAEESKAIDEQIASDPDRLRVGRCLVRGCQADPGALPRGLRAGGATEGGDQRQLTLPVNEGNHQRSRVSHQGIGILLGNGISPAQ